MEIASKGLRPCQWSDSFRNTTRAAPTNTVEFYISRRYRACWIQLFVSETEFDRSMSQVVKGSRGSKTITFPSTARSVLECAFQGTPLRSAVLNEGLRELGSLGDDRFPLRGMAFSGTQIRKIVLPATLRVLGRSALQGCERLRSVTFAPKSRLEKIGALCFSGSGIERIAIPKGVREIRDSAFRECENLKEVVFDKGSRLSTVAVDMFCCCKSLASVRLPEGLR